MPLTPQNNASLWRLWVSSLPTFLSSVSWLFLTPHFQSPPPLLIPRRWKSFRALLSGPFSTYPWEELYQHLGFSYYHLHSATVGEDLWCFCLLLFQILSIQPQPIFWWQHLLFVWGPSLVLTLSMGSLMGRHGWSCDMGLPPASSL